MPKVCYTPRKFTTAVRGLIDHADRIIGEYEAEGYDLTLRQLYYQFVSRDLLRNTQQEYRRLGSIINEARLAGLIDWERIEDRTRDLQSLSHWASPSEIVGACSEQFHLDLWATQKCRVEVWIEKDALSGVFDRVCTELDVPYFSCRGYTSQSEMWSAAQRLRRHMARGQKVVILHFGDHDPSGIDMTRDINDRLDLFLVQDWIDHEMGELSSEGGSCKVSESRDSMEERCGARRIEVRRMALTMGQVEEYDPPPNPARMTDARFEEYQRLYGDESWELDALEPRILAGLVRTEVESLCDREAWDVEVSCQDEGRRKLKRVATQWSSLTRGL